LVSAEFVEVNPILDHRNGTAALAVELPSSLLGRKFLSTRSRRIAPGGAISD
jgi:arginase